MIHQTRTATRLAKLLIGFAISVQAYAATQLPQPTPCASATTTGLPPTILSISAETAPAVVLLTPHSAAMPPLAFFALSNNTVQLTLTFRSHGFVATPQLECPVRLPALLPGDYRLEYYLWFDLAQPPTFVEARAFAVPDVASAIPTAQHSVLLVLAVLITFIGAIALLRQSDAP